MRARAADVSFVIQGPVERRGFGSTARTCAAIRVHFPGAEIVVSSWEGSGVDGLNCDEVVLSPDPGPVPPSGQNTNRQIIGSLAGIRAASRPLVAKVRSDIVFHSRALLEHRERWTARAGELRVFEQRLLVPHVYTRRPTYLSPLPHHPSDWALLGLREDLELLFDVPLLVNDSPLVTAEGELATVFGTGSIGPTITPEQYIWTSALRKVEPRLRLDHQWDLTPETLQATELAFANNLAVLETYGQYGVSCPKYSDAGRRFEDFTLCSHGHWLELYETHCLGSGRPDQAQAVLAALLAEDRPPSPAELRELRQGGRSWEAQLVESAHTAPLRRDPTTGGRRPRFDLELARLARAQLGLRDRTWAVQTTRQRADYPGVPRSPAVIVVAGPDTPGLADQLAALGAALEGGEHEVVLVEPEDRPSALPAGLSGRVRRVPVDATVGRREAIRRGVGATSADACVVLGPLARPLPGFAEPLAGALGDDVELAAPAIEAGAGTVLGYSACADGSVVPILAPGTQPDALALDCLAAPRHFWLDLIPTPDVEEGVYELQVAKAAGGAPALAVVPEARVRRASCGPPASVVVCTRDRAGELEPCVEALVAAGGLADGCEIVIVDSASSDETPATAAALAERFPSVKLVREERPGLSRARMAGAAAACTDVLVYLDDDARPAPGWLESVRDAFVDPETVVVGGPIHALWPNRPSWRPPAALAPYYSILDRGDRAYATELGDFYGANWSIRRSALDAIGGFDARWGAGEHGVLPGEESAAEHAVRRLGLGFCRFAPGAAVGHRIEPARLDERWLLTRTYRHGLILPHVAAGFLEPAREQLEHGARRAAAALTQATPLAGSLDAEEALRSVLDSPAPLEVRAAAARELGTLVGSLILLGADHGRVGELNLRVRAENAAGRVSLGERRAAESAGAERAGARGPGFRLVDGEPVPNLRALAIVPAFNEADVIRHSVIHLIEQGLDVLLLDNHSSDGTAERVEHLLGRGLVGIERFPADAGFDERNARHFVVRDQLRRFEQIAAELDYDWYVISDADEFRESPWPGTTLAEGIALADAAGFNALQFELFNFRPVDDGFEPGTDVRERLTGYEPPELFDRGQVKAWRDPGGPVDLSELFGEGARFPGRRVCPIPFLLRHYPIRGETHGRRKVLHERLPRFAPEERRDGWHVQYDRFAASGARFLWDPVTLTTWDGAEVRARLLGRALRDLLLAQACRGLELPGIEPQAEEVAAWLGRALGSGSPTGEEIRAAVDRVGRVGSVPGELDRDPLALGASRLLLREHALAGRWDVAAGMAEVSGHLGRSGASTRRFAALAFADELMADPTLLEGYGRQFGGSDDATLVILAEDAELERLVSAVAEAGLDGDGSPDLLAVTGPDQQPGSLHALFSRREQPGHAYLPRVGDPRELRTLAERTWREAA